MPQTYRNNALHDIAMKVIELIHDAHKNGTGSVPLNMLARLFGLSLSESDFEILGQRGDFSFARSDADGGILSNVANALDFHASLEAYLI
jgi:hypothetical protein